MQLRRASVYVLVYLLWIVSSAVALVAAWFVRNAYLLATGVLTAGAAAGDSHQQFRVTFVRNAVDRFGVVILGILLVIFLVLVEHFYRTGAEQGRLRRRFMIVTAAEICVLFLAQAVQVVASGMLGVFAFNSVLLALGVLVLAVGSVWLAARSSAGRAGP